MDFWVFVAAATAGCLTKYLKSSQRGFKGYNASTINGSGYVDCLAQGGTMNGYAVTSPTGVLEGTMSVLASTAEVPSTSGSNETVARDLEDFNFLSIASVPTEYTVENTDVERGNRSTSDDIFSGSGDGGAKNFGGRTCSFRRSLVKSYSSLRSRYRPLKTNSLTSLESCVLAQLYNHHREQNVDAHVLPRPSSSSTVRPLNVTNGNNIISRRSDGFVRGQVVPESHLTGSDNVIGVPPLPRIKKRQTKIRRDRSLGISSGTVSRRKFSTQHVAIRGIIMFSLGVYTGILSSVARKKTEVDKLKELLKQSENLVQDLQEELEMKDSLIVKELDNDMYGLRITRQTSFPNGAPTSSSYEWHEDDSSKEPYNPRMDRSMDCMSKIEAELEAELGRLGLNVGCCNIQLNKMDFSGRDCAEDGSSTSSTAPSANYSVSPRALTLRLHEVIQSRLEERIQELELALENSQRKVRLMESAQKSRSSRQSLNGMARPVVMNMSGDALGAYDGACEEFIMFDSSEDNSPSSGYNYLPRRTKRNGVEEKLGAVSGRMPIDPRETLSGAQEIDSFGMSRDESSDADDELLIRQLVERTKRGSPVVMKAQWRLFSDRDIRTEANASIANYSNPTK